MALTRRASDFVYSSSSGGVYYDFTVSVDSNNLITVRNISTPTGRIVDSYTPLPQVVMDDIQTAIGQVRNIVGQVGAISGTTTFTSVASANVTFVTAQATSTYRVYVDIPDFISYRITNKATTGFTIQLSTAFTGVVGWDVLL